MKEFFVIFVFACLLAISLGALFSGSIFLALTIIVIQIFLVKKIINPPNVVSNKKAPEKKVSIPVKVSVSSTDIEKSIKNIAVAPMPPLVSFKKIRIVGVSFDNEDGSSRQLILSGLRCNEEVKIKKNPSEQYPDRISVYTSNFRCIGALSAEMSNLLQYFNFSYAVGRVNSSGKSKNGLFWGAIDFDIQLESHEKVEQSENKAESVKVKEKYPPILFYYFLDLFIKQTSLNDLVFAQHKNLGILKIDMQSLRDFYVENNAQPKYIFMKNSNDCESRKFSLDESFFKEYFKFVIVERCSLVSGSKVFPVFNIGKTVLKHFGMEEDGKKPRPVYLSPEELYEIECENYIPDDIYDDDSDYWRYEEY